MSGVTLKRFTSYEVAVGVGYLPVHVNPDLVCFVMPRRRYDSKADRDSLDGTLIHFAEEGGVLAVKEDIGLVVSTLTSQGGACKDCYTPLPKAWMSMCDDCRAHQVDQVRAEQADNRDRGYHVEDTLAETHS